MMNIDRRVIYILLFLSLSIPLIKPMGLPLSVGPATQQLYNYIDKLPPDSKVVISMDTSPGGWGELMPGAIAIVNHLVDRKAKIYVVGFFDAGPSLFEGSYSSTKLKDAKYGVDWVDLGYRAGGENGISAFAGDVIKTFPKDFRGNDTAGLEIMKGIKTAKDFNLILTVSSGTPGSAEWIRQVRDPMGTPLSGMVVAVNIPGLAPYLQSGQMTGVVAGLRGAAEYEQITKTAGLGSAGMDAQSISHLLILVLVILGNIGFYLTDRTKRAGREGR
jgi:hypothetical protein